MNQQSDIRLIRIISALCCDPWLIKPEMHKVLTDIALAHAMGGEAEESQHAKAAAMGRAQGKRIFTISGSTAIIPFEGVIGRKFADCLNSSGVVSIDIAERMIKAAGDDEEIDSLCLVFDSPGGVAMGVSEVGSTISNVNERKPCVAYVDGLCCSAAYWLASQCSAVYAMGSSEVGSIGAYMAVLDRSRQAEMQGIHAEVFKSGKHKAMGFPGTTLSDEQKLMLQTRIDEMGAGFKAQVRKGRNKQISDDVMQGQSFSAQAAMQNGLIDSVTDFATAIRDAAALAKTRAVRK
jgi:signal peptide peptidase SppA